MSILLFFISFFLISCSLKTSTNNHGILNIEKRSNKLKSDYSNFNDVIQVMGQPHTKSIENKNTWIYFERVLSKGKYYKLGQNIIQKNNVLVLEFDKYGILKDKTLLTKADIKNINFSGKKTTNEITEKTFVQNVLQSIKQKMYRNR